MNCILKNLALMLLIGFCVDSNAQAVTANVSVNGIIQVNESMPWQDVYYFDISKLNFSNQVNADNFFAKYTKIFSNFGYIQVDLSKQIASLHIEKKSLDLRELTPKILNENLLTIYKNF